MTCAATVGTFRLLDAYVGWDAASATNIVGLDDANGATLASSSGGVTLEQWVPYICPPRLAFTCTPCTWYLITPAPPASWLMRWDACNPCWERCWRGAAAELPRDCSAIAVWRHRIAVADREAGAVLVWTQAGDRLLLRLHVPNPQALAFAPSGELLVAAGSQILCFGPDGLPRGPLPEAPGAVAALAVDDNHTIWVVTEDSGGYGLWRRAPGEEGFEAADPSTLGSAFAVNGLALVTPEGFEIDDGQRVQAFSWYGRCLQPGELVPPPPAVRYPTQGQLLTCALDSGIPRCRWHRIRVDADVPVGTNLDIAVATAELPPAQPAGDASRDPRWKAFPAGVPHFSDWTSAPPGSTDFLIDQPAGRYLYVRLRLSGDGTASPVVRRLRIDFPRVTSLDRLPAVYRENSQAADFTERFLALFDASIEDIDRIIERYPALLDPSGIPEQLLPWLGGFFDIGFDSTWSADRRRAILAQAPQLYQQRGTLAGLQLAIQLVFGIEVAIQESSPVGPWGALGTPDVNCIARCGEAAQQAAVRRTARLGSVRLFGKARARFRLGASPLSGAPLRSSGNPDLDPFADGAYKLQILVPPMPDHSPRARDELTQLIEAQKPAHTVATIRFGGTGFVLGCWSAVGIDTAFIPPPASVLGASGNIRLGRSGGVLAQSRGGPPPSAVLGRDLIVGIHTFTE